MGLNAVSIMTRTTSRLNRVRERKTRVGSIQVEMIRQTLAIVTLIIVKAMPMGE